MIPYPVADGGVPTISVVLPVFNGGHFLEKAVRSILLQTLHNFELLVIDDGSTDDTPQILRELKSQDSRVIVVSRGNRGLVATLNEGVQMARGAWIARMDADDIAEPNRFDRQLQWLEHTGADICGSWVRFFGGSDRRVLRHPQSDDAVKAELLFGAPFAHPTVMMRAALAKELHYDPAWEKCEDYDLWERAARAGWRMTNVPVVLLRYRQHESQISNAFSIYQQQLSQKIRRRYWEFFLTSKKIENLQWVNEVMKLREPAPTAVDMEQVDSAFRALLASAEGEAKDTIFHHMTQLYLRGSADCPNMALRWSRLNKKYGRGSGLNIKIQIALLSFFRIQPDSVTLEKAKKAYFYLKSR